MGRPRKYSLEHALFRWRTLFPRNSKTHQVYAASWVKRWGNRDIRSLTLVELREWKIVRARSVSLATVRVELCVLSGAFKAAKEDGIKVENIVRQLGWDQIHNERQVYFSEAEEAKLHTLLCPDLREYARFSVLTGLRIGEQLAITWPDVRGSKLWVRAQKTERGRWIPLSEEAQAILAARKELPVPFPLAYRQVAEPFTRALKRAGIQGGCWHCWRHTFASRLVAKGVSLYKVSRLLGHRGLTMTQRYSHLAMEDLEETVGLLSSGLSTREDRLTQQLEVLTRQVAALGALVGREVLPG